MYRRPKFLEVLIEIRQEMARQADYDADFFAEMIRSGKTFADEKKYHLGEPDANDEQSRKKNAGKR